MTYCALLSSALAMPLRLGGITVLGIKGKKNPCLGVVWQFAGFIRFQYESLAHFIARL